MKFMYALVGAGWVHKPDLHVWWWKYSQIATVSYECVHGKKRRDESETDVAITATSMHAGTWSFITRPDWSCTKEKGTKDGKAGNKRQRKQRHAVTTKAWQRKTKWRSKDKTELDVEWKIFNIIITCTMLGPELVIQVMTILTRLRIPFLLNAVRQGRHAESAAVQIQYSSVYYNQRFWFKPASF